MISAQIDKIVAQMLGTENFAKTHVGDDALDTAKQVSSKKIDAANGSWVVRAFKHGDKTFVQVQNPDKEVYYVALGEAVAESKENKIVVPNLKPRDPNHEILKNKRNAGGFHRDKKRDMKNGEGKYKEKITFKEWLSESTSKTFQVRIANDDWQDLALGASSLQDIADVVEASPVDEKTHKKFDVSKLTEIVHKWIGEGPNGHGSSWDEMDYEVLSLKHDVLKIKYTFVGMHRGNEVKKTGIITIME